MDSINGAIPRHFNPHNHPSHNVSFLNLPGRERSVRTTAHAAQASLTSSFALGRMFSNIKADVRMFWRAYVSMGHGTTPQDIRNRIGALEVFEEEVVQARTSELQQAILGRYRLLDRDVKKLLVRVDEQFVRSFSAEGNRALFEERKNLILRECNLACNFQRKLTIVNTYYRVFKRLGSRPRVPAPIPVSSPSSRSVLPSIPGTIPYPQNAIPADLMANLVRENDLRWNPDNTLPRNPAIPPICQFFRDQLPREILNNAEEIARLKAAASQDVLDNALQLFNCPVTGDLMEIPVFVASHPAVQASINKPVLTDADFIARHHLDFNAMEAHLLVKQTRHGTRAVCAVCRHPQDQGRSINREHLVVDTTLQTRILNYLRNPTAAAAAAGGS